MPAPHEDHSILPAQALWVARIDYLEAYELPAHRHDYFQLFCFIEGEGQVVLEGQTYSVSGPSIFVVPGSRVHGLRAKSCLKSLDIKFRVHDASLAKQLCQSAGLVRDDVPEVLELLKRIRAEGIAQQVGFRAICDALLTQLLILLVRSQCSHEEAAVSAEALSGAQVPIIIATLDYLSRHVGEAVRLGDLASALGYSARQFGELFRVAAGMSPMAFCRQVRLKGAQELVEETELPLKQIAAEQGFGSVHHFNRAFAEFTGVPPAEWRRRAREGVGLDVHIESSFDTHDWEPIANFVKSSA